MYWFHTDLNSAPLEMSDGKGAVRWSGHYGGWGEVGRLMVDSVELRQGQPVIDQPIWPCPLITLPIMKEM
ncbi:RHS domain-containing protein [Brenneria sp. L4-2C]|nr:RHS domain-containing protein [Brenneria sp. L4-2C]MDX5697892.1 RHS domain-containing protein [Brenneria sp. L4-2C]